jgi:ABC-type transport system involved in cytochrome c biogenesis permease subunit
MKKSLIVLVTWVLVMYLFGIMFLHYFLDRSYTLRTYFIIVFAIGIAISVITYVFEKQSNRIEMLENRIKDLEVNR